jgi:predicted lipoprotein with Yx(FWY)xxD motif
MKKRIVILMSAFILTITSSYASKNEGIVPESVVSAFSHNFYQARDAKWEKRDNYYKVTFNQAGGTLFAFYSEDNDFMGVANYMYTDRLPPSLISDLKKNYGDYWITDLFKYSTNEGIGYFITVENGDQKIMLRSDGRQKWQSYKKIKK